MKNIFVYLELNAVEICVLKDIKSVICKFYEPIVDLENDVETISLLSPHQSRDILNEFFFSLGPKKSKELINLFRKIKVKFGANVFENEVFIFYLCIDDVNFFKLLYVLDRNNFDDCDRDNFDDCDRDNFDDFSISIYEKFRLVKKNLKLRLGNYHVYESL
ncbi:conserved hypothetical protein (plasmid) [Borreliella bissettiae DN127]|uniref:Uncharacterized protein n=1 Tax=Borrelia bissettiae (strain DSM 17990 / CIP 109136 / DN127) TaxID=521010 RepID=G0ANY0_BORBD|nr:P52 family lipoprotein [Borreliella bissettiae]AEL19406.1 conserved hypothetical protein [Borreliella bissettiae DN127]